MSALDPLKSGVAVFCAKCKRQKHPCGRSVSPYTEGSYCGYECDGYTKKPHVGSLWPGESESEFGYPVANVGTTKEAS